MRALFILVSLGLLALVACATTPLVPLEPPRSPEEALYRKRCGSCHDLYPPHAYSDRRWVSLVRRMGPSAGLDASQEEALLRWLQEHNR